MNWDSMLSCAQVVQRLEKMGMKPHEVVRVAQPRLKEDEGWEVVAVKQWVLERYRYQSRDTSWKLRGALEDQGAGEEIRRWWEISLWVACASDFKRGESQGGCGRA